MINGRSLRSHAPVSACKMLVRNSTTAHLRARARAGTHQVASYATGLNVLGRTFLRPDTSIWRKANRPSHSAQTEIAAGNSSVVVCDEVVNIFWRPETFWLFGRESRVCE